MRSFRSCCCATLLLNVLRWRAKCLTMSFEVVFTPGDFSSTLINDLWWEMHVGPVLWYLLACQTNKNTWKTWRRCDRLPRTRQTDRQACADVEVSPFFWFECRHQLCCEPRLFISVHLHWLVHFQMQKYTLGAAADWDNTSSCWSCCYSGASIAGQPWSLPIWWWVVLRL